MKLVNLFKYRQPLEFRLIAQDEQGNVAIKDFYAKIEYPLNVAIHTDSLFGEPDSQALPSEVSTDSNGGVIAARYDLKQYAYLITDRQVVSNINVEYSLDDVNWNDVNFEIITVDNWDYVKVVIPEFGRYIKFKIIDGNVNESSRKVSFYSQYYP